jgi:hypothetical protein
MFEIPQKKQVEQKSLDDAWYERFKTIGAFSDYEYLTGTREHRENQKENFIKGAIENPQLDYPELKNFNFAEKERGLLELKKDVLEKEARDAVRQAYRWKINEKIAELRMMKTALNGNDKKFSRYSRFIYGQPEKNIYNYTISQIKKPIDRHMFDYDSSVRDAATRLNEKLFDALMANESELDPRAYDMPTQKSTKEDLSYSSEEIKCEFEKALISYGLDGWEVVIDNKGRFTSVNVSQENKIINIPEERRLKETSLKSLIAHEIGTHVLRRENGEKSKLRLLGLGLDRYLKGEEGIATYQEQQIGGAKEFSGLDGHLAISLAMGVDGKKRTFREVFEILKDYYFITSSKEDASEKTTSAENSAWNRCIRTFRGTTCQTPGACLTRDIVYREGNIGIWSLVKKSPEEVERFSVGKYDATNSNHIWILEQLGIGDEELAILESRE